MDFNRLLNYGGQMPQGYGALNSYGQHNNQYADQDVSAGFNLANHQPVDPFASFGVLSGDQNNSVPGNLYDTLNNFGINGSVNNSNKQVNAAPLTGFQKFGQGLTAAKGVADLFLAMKQYGLSQKNYKHNRNLDNKNYANNVASYNDQLEERWIRRNNHSGGNGGTGGETLASYLDRKALT